MVPHEANRSQNTGQFLSYTKSRNGAIHRSDAVAAHRFAASRSQWLYELKLDGYRAIAFRRNGGNQSALAERQRLQRAIPAVVEALAKLPENTVIDGEVVAFDQEGRPSFNALQNYGSAPAPVVYYVFDLWSFRART